MIFATFSANILKRQILYLQTLIFIFSSTMADWTVDYFGPELLTKDGKKSTKDALAGKTRIAIYFSAHWVSSKFALTKVTICLRNLEY